MTTDLSPQGLGRIANRCHAQLAEMKRPIDQRDGPYQPVGNPDETLALLFALAALRSEIARLHAGITAEADRCESVGHRQTADTLRALVTP